MNKIWILACVITSSVCAQTISIGPLAKGLPAFSVTSTPNAEYSGFVSLGGMAKVRLPDLFLPIDFSLHVLYGRKVIFNREPTVYQGNPIAAIYGFKRSISQLEVGAPITYELFSSIIIVHAGVYLAFDEFTVTEVTQPIDVWGNLGNKSEDEYSKIRFGFWPIAEFSIFIGSPVTATVFTEYRLSEFVFDFPDPSSQSGQIHYDATYKLNGFQFGFALAYSF